MKWLFALLLAANVALFMWGQWYRAPLVGAGPPAPPRDVAAEKIRLLTEPGVRLLLRSREQAALAVPVPTAAARCFRLGPFAQGEVAGEAARVLRAEGFEPRRVAGAEARPRAYHVYLPPLASREAAERRRGELTKLGFRDHALIQEQGLENGISLGVFTIEANARARAEELAGRGVPAQVRPLPGNRSVSWLRLASPADRVARLKRLADRDWGAADVTLQPIPCPGAPTPLSSPGD